MNIEEKISTFQKSNYVKFYWWRRFKPRTPPFKHRSLLQKIQNGNYDYSDYRVQALYELELAEIKSNIFPKYAYTERDEAIKMGRMRYNKLMIDFDKDESNLLKTIEREFCKVFGISKEEFDLYVLLCDGGLEELYNTIKENTLYKFIENGR